MRATTVGIALLLLFLCAGVLALGSYGGFEIFRLKSAQDQVAIATATPVTAEKPAATADAPPPPRCDEGKLALSEKRFDEAVDDLESCVAASPDNAEALFARGRAYAGIERFELAEVDLSHALELDGTNQAGWETLSFVRVRLGNDTGAIDALDHWLALNPAAGEAYRARADAMYRLGKVDLATHDARRACDLGVADGCVLEERIRSVRR